MVSTAYILCGGKGTRMGAVSQQIPKPMLPLMGKPVLEHIIVQCKSNGINNITLITGYLGHVIEEYFDDGSRLGVHITYFREELPLGTTGALKCMEDELPETFWVLYGDVIFDMHLSRMYNFHLSKQAAMTIAAHPNDHPYDSDLLVLDAADRVVHVHPKPHTDALRTRNMVNAALYLVNKRTIQEIPTGKSDWGRHQLPALCKKIPIYAWRTTEYIKDMGTPERIQKVEKDLFSDKPSRRNLKLKQKAIFLDRDGVINEDIDLIHHSEQLKVYPYVPSAIRRINQSDYLSIVVTNQSVVARGLASITDLDRIHAEMDYQLAAGSAFVDDLYYCPHHPDKGFEGEVPELKTECECRKPKPGMLLKAAERYNINLEESWIIGDRYADIEAGHRAGCTTVGVLTGNGLRNTMRAPDFTFQNLAEAVDFILNEPHTKTAEQIFDHFILSDTKPYIIAIAGNTGSGKSTLASFLARYFQKKGKNTEKIELDHWILAPELRSSNHDISEIYQIKRIEQDLQMYFSGHPIIPTGYKRHPTWKITPPLYKLNDQIDVVIVEGIVAFMLDTITGRFHRKIFCKASENRFNKNLLALNRWKGRSDEEIERMISQRQKTEYVYIQSQEKKADMTVMLE